jgi:D-tyrosyl-tRNA(Tyr) deacylase
MRAVLQRVTSGAVDVEGAWVAEIGRGILVLLGVRRADAERDAEWIAAKLANLRIFDDADGKLNLSLLEIGGAALMVPNFTLYGDPRNGRRPSYAEAAPFVEGKALFERCCAALRNLGVHVEQGVYGATMAVHLVNDGPVTLIVESDGI